MQDNECEVFLGGRKRVLRYNTRALKFLEEKTGKSFLSGAMNASDIGLGWITSAVQAGLQHYGDAGMNEQTIEDWFDALSRDAAPGPESDNLMSITQKASKALAGDIPGVPRPKAVNGAEVPLASTAS